MVILLSFINNPPQEIGNRSSVTISKSYFRQGDQSYVIVFQQLQCLIQIAIIQYLSLFLFDVQRNQEQARLQLAILKVEYVSQIIEGNPGMILVDGGEQIKVVSHNTLATELGNLISEIGSESIRS